MSKTTSVPQRLHEDKLDNWEPSHPKYNSTAGDLNDPVILSRCVCVSPTEAP